MRLVRPLFLHARNDVGFPLFFPLFPARCQVGTLRPPFFSARLRVGLPHLPARRQVGFPPLCPSHVSPVRPRLRPSRPPCSRTADLLTARYPARVCSMSRQGTPPFCPCPCRAPRLHRLSRPMPRRKRPCLRLRPRPRCRQPCSPRGGPSSAPCRRPCPSSRTARAPPRRPSPPPRRTRAPSPDRGGRPCPRAAAPHRRLAAHGRRHRTSRGRRPRRA